MIAGAAGAVDGCIFGASTKIVDRASGEVHSGRAPEYSVVVPGSLPGKDGGPALACAVIVSESTSGRGRRPALMSC